MKFSTMAASFAASLALALGGQAQANTLITFEEAGITAMSNSPGSVVPAGAQLSDLFLATLGVSFSSGAGYAAVSDHGYPALTPTPPNILGGANADGTLNYGAPISAAFFSTLNTSVFATTNYVRVLGDLFPLGSGTVTLKAYNVLGTEIGSVTDDDISEGPVLALNVAGIHSVSFFGSSGTVGFDNFEFGDLTAVPEPATWTMMLAGFAGLGAALRARRWRAVIA